MLYNYFMTGLSSPYMFVSEAEALTEVCKYVEVFSSPHSAYHARLILIYEAGKCLGCIKSFDVSILMNIFTRCTKLELGESIELPVKEKLYIKSVIEGSFFKPFYE